MSFYREIFSIKYYRAERVEKKFEEKKKIQTEYAT